jgi:hypothetical protein
MAVEAPIYGYNIMLKSVNRKKTTILFPEVPMPIPLAG